MTNDALIASNKADLLDGSINTPLNRDELGNVVSGNVNIWTGTTFFFGGGLGVLVIIG